MLQQNRLFQAIIGFCAVNFLIGVVLIGIAFVTAYPFGISAMAQHALFSPGMGSIGSSVALYVALALVQQKT